MKEKRVECASVPCWLPESVAKQVDDLHKTLPADCGYQRKSYQVEYQFEPGERAEVSVITSNSKDKADEVVLPEGMDLEVYRKNSIVLWNHDPNKPVARCGWVKLHKNEIRAKTIYPEIEEGGNWSEFVNDVWAMTRSGVLRSKSVSFLPLTPKRSPTSDELAEHPEWDGAGIFDQTLLLEYSCVSVGCNHDCLVEAINTKSVTAEHLTALGLEIPTVEKIITSPTQITSISDSDSITLPRAEKIIAKKADLKEALAAVLAYSKRPKVKRKKVDVAQLVKREIEKALGMLDVEKIIARAKDAHRNRGRV